MSDEEFEELQQKAALHFTIKNRVLKLIEELSELNEVVLTAGSFEHFQEELLDSLVCTRILCIQLGVKPSCTDTQLKSCFSPCTTINGFLKKLAKELYRICLNSGELKALRETIAELNDFLAILMQQNFTAQLQNFSLELIERKKEQLRAALQDDCAF